MSVEWTRFRGQSRALVTSRLLWSWFSCSRTPRAQVVEGRVSSLTVVKALDVLEDGSTQLASGWPWLAVHELLLDRREEALRDSVVVGVTA